MEDNEMTRRFIQNAFTTWINPEIERRKQKGTLPTGFSLYQAQIIFDLDLNAPEVRLNEEVKAVLLVRAARAIKRGEPVGMDAFSEIHDINLTQLDPNAAHVTLVAHNGRWHLKFDFRYNAARIAQLLKAARQFLDCATFAADKGQGHAFFDNLFSATELMAKAALLWLPDAQFVQSRKHKHVAAKFNSWSKLGNIDQKFARLLNKLAQVRQDARYVAKGNDIDCASAKADLLTAEEMYRQVLAGSPVHRAPLGAELEKAKADFARPQPPQKQ